MLVIGDEGLLKELGRKGQSEKRKKRERVSESERSSRGRRPAAG